MKKTFRAKVTKEPTGLKVTGESRGFSVTLDEPETLGGTNEGMNPVEMVLCALGSCECIVASTFAKQQDFKYESLWVELEGDLDPAGFLGDPNVRPGFQEIRVVFHFKTDETLEKCEEFSKFMESRCPVFDNLTNGVPVVCADVIKE